MPMPTPNSGETQDEFVERCMVNDTMLADYPEDDQRLAVCFSQWRDRTMAIKKETRGFGLDTIEVRADDDGHLTIRGHAAVFDTLSGDLGGFREKISPGAFSGSVDGDVLAFWNHNPDIVLGRTPDTLRVEEDDIGLAFELDPPRSRADLVESIQRGDVRGVSFGFQTINDSWETVDGEEIRTLEEVRLIEVSPTALPAYPATDVSVALRSRERWHEKHDTPAELEAWRRVRQAKLERYGSLD